MTEREPDGFFHFHIKFKRWTLFSVTIKRWYR